MKSLRIAIFACFVCLCFGRTGLTQEIVGSTTLDIDPDTDTVTVTCETYADADTEAYYRAEVHCWVYDDSNNRVAAGNYVDNSGLGYAQVVLSFTGVPGTTYTAYGTHVALAVFNEELYSQQGDPIFLGFDDAYNYGFFEGNPQTYADTYDWYGPGPDTPRRAPAQTTGTTEAMGTPPQIPTSLKFLSATVLSTGTTGGCTSGADYGIRVDVIYQLLDQANHPLKQGGLTPYESVQFAGGQLSYNPIGGTTASDGTFHDVPLGLCSAAAISNATQLQIIYIDSPSQKVRQQTFTYNSTASGHGSMSNGNDVSAMR